MNVHIREEKCQDPPPIGQALEIRDVFQGRVAGPRLGSEYCVLVPKYKSSELDEYSVKVNVGAHSLKPEIGKNAVAVASLLDCCVGCHIYRQRIRRERCLKALVYQRVLAIDS